MKEENIVYQRGMTAVSPVPLPGMQAQTINDWKHTCLLQAVVLIIPLILFWALIMAFVSVSMYIPHILWAFFIFFLQFLTYTWSRFYLDTAD